MSLLMTLVGLLFWSVAPTVVGWESALIVSGSMAPGIHAGDIVVVRPMDAATVVRTPLQGAVVQVDNPVRPGELLVHRVVGRDNGAVITKGDANAARDYVPVQPEHVRGVARLRVPYAGLPVLWVRNRERVPLIALGVGLLVLAWPDRRTRRAPRS